MLPRMGLTLPVCSTKGLLQVASRTRSARISCFSDWETKLEKNDGRADGMLDPRMLAGREHSTWREKEHRKANGFRYQVHKTDSLSLSPLARNDQASMSLAAAVGLTAPVQRGRHAHETASLACQLVRVIP
jgi:hypothetical protein